MNKLISFAFSVFVVILSSCTTAYIPTEIDTPAFHKNNEFKGGLSYGSSGTNLHLGYSFYKNFAVVGEISYLHAQTGDAEFQRNWGFGFGYFNNIPKEKSVYFEVLSGFNTGETRSSYKEQDFTNGPGFENSKYFKVYIQPDISFSYSFVDLIFSLRCNYMRFTEYAINKTPNPELPLAIGMEPAFTFKIGSENVKMKFQMGLSLTGSVSGYDFNYNKFFSHIGIEFGL